MVFVYTDLASAQAEQSRAEARELAESPGASASVAPHLVPGYGPSTWLGNVALVESTFGQLGQLYAAQHAQDDPGAIITAVQVQSANEQVMRTVDADFVAALSNGTVNL
jgi:hypothetical protein